MASEFFPPVIFEIKAKATEAMATFGAVNKELATMEKNGQLAGGSLGGLQKSSKYAGAALLGLGGAFAVFAAASVKETSKVEDSQVALQNAVKNTGVSFNYIKPLVDQSTATMRNLGFTTEDTNGALTAITRASGSPALALKLLGASADLARAKQISLAQAGTLLARASIGQAKGLGDLGIAIGKTIPKGASLDQIIAAVEKRVGGTATAFKNTLSGSIQVANANFKDLQNQLGTALLPVLTKFTDWIIKTGLPALKSLGKWISDNQGLFEGIVTALALIWAVPKIAGIITAITTIKDAFVALRTVLIGVDIAEAFATAGASVGMATLALAGAATVYGTYHLFDELSKKSKKSNAGVSRVPSPSSMPSLVTSLNDPNIQGSGVNRIPTSSSASKSKKLTLKQQEHGIVTQTTVNQYNTIYTNNPNDIAKKAAQAIKTGSTKGK